MTKALVGTALLLGLIGTVLGAIAVFGGSDEYETLTFELRGGEEIRSEAPARHAEESNQTISYGAEQAISGDRSGEYTRMCEPIAADDFQCLGALLLDDGAIDIVETGEDENPSVASVIGGTGAYESARGTVEIDFESDIYTVNLELPGE